MREMRLKKQELSTEQAITILEKGTSGVLAVAGDEEYPYAVPMSYVYADGKLYFHGAKSGHKIDAIKKQEKVSFCVIDKDTVVPEEYTTYYRSVIVFGKAHLLEGEDKRKGLKFLGEKYMPQFKMGYLEEIDKKVDHMSVIELEIEHITGKEAIELV